MENLSSVTHSIMQGILKKQIIISIGLVSIALLAVVVGIIYAKTTYTTSKVKAISVVILSVFSLVTLLVLRYNAVASCYCDYKNQSYIVLQNGQFHIKYGNVGVLENVHTLTTECDGKEVSLKIFQQEDALFDTGYYKGNIVFSKKSKYVLQYDLIPANKTGGGSLS